MIWKQLLLFSIYLLEIRSIVILYFHFTPWSSRLNGLPVQSTIECFSWLWWVRWKRGDCSLGVAFLNSMIRAARFSIFFWRASIIPAIEGADHFRERSRFCCSRCFGESLSSPFVTMLLLPWIVSLLTWAMACWQLFNVIDQILMANPIWIITKRLIVY